MGAVNTVIAMVARSRSGPVTYSTPLTDWEYEHMIAAGRSEQEARREADRRRREFDDRFLAPGDVTRIEMWECSHCGNVFVSRPTSCPGCAGREFR